jgi:hypothetical protein
VTVRLAISVEGPTEYEFCREVLRSHLATFDVHIEPKIVVTKRNLVGPNATGGSVSIDRFRNEVRRLLPSFDYVSTLYDFYGFKGLLPGETPDALCLRMSESLENPPRLIPYIQVHEFEALLFSAPPVLARYLASQPFSQALEAAVNACGGAEQINDDPQRKRPIEATCFALPRASEPTLRQDLSRSSNCDGDRSACDSGRLPAVRWLANPIGTTDGLSSDVPLSQAPHRG